MGSWSNMVYVHLFSEQFSLSDLITADDAPVPLLNPHPLPRVYPPLGLLLLPAHDSPGSN